MKIMNVGKIDLCPCCGMGNLQTLERDYVADIGDGQKVTVPHIQMEVCDKCGEEILPLESAREVDSAIAEYTDRLSPDELSAIRKEFGVDQTEMGEVLGLGSKTYHRWEKGSQYPSRSMGYYLRVLGENPQVFEWLRSRGWRGRNRLVVKEKPPFVDLQRRFPALAAEPSRLKTVAGVRINYAGILFAGGR